MRKFHIALDQLIFEVFLHYLLLLLLIFVTFPDNAEESAGL